MLMDRGHRQARGEQIQPTNALLESRVHGGLSCIGAKRDTGDLPQLLCSPNQPRERRAWNTGLLCNSGLGCPGQHLLHSSQIAVEAFPSLLIDGGRIKRWTRNRRGGCEGDGRWHALRFRHKRVWERLRDKRRSIWWKQDEIEPTIQRALLQ